MDVRKIAVGIVAAYIFCLGAAVAVSAEEPAADQSVDVGSADPVPDTPVDVGAEETLESAEGILPPDTPIEDSSTQDGESADAVMPPDTPIEDGSTQYDVLADAVMDRASGRPVEVIVVDVIEDSPVYTVWDKPFNEYQPTEAFTFLLVVFAILAGMVKFISWAWL